MHKTFTPCTNWMKTVAALSLGGAVLSLAPAAFAQNAPNATGQNSQMQNDTHPAPNPNLQVPLVTVPADFGNMKLQPGFLLNVQVYGEGDLSGPARVDNNGDLHIPFLKPVHVAGDTISGAKDKIETAFREQGILKNPQVTVDVQQFAATHVTVVGEVQNPGRIELLAPHTLLDVIGLAGGETAMAGNTVELKRANKKPDDPAEVFTYVKGGDSTSVRNVMVNPGDTVLIKRAGIVYVLGAVNRPGGYTMQENGELDVAQAISLAQGLTLQARVGGLRVVQHGPDGRMIETPISYNKIMDGKQKPMQLAAGDIVYVPVSHTKSVLSATTGLIGQTTAASIYVMK